MTALRIVEPPSPMLKRHCTCCGRLLRGSVAWLELDQRTDTYHDRGGVPPDASQGWFPFGLTCARRMLANAGQ